MKITEILIEIFIFSIIVICLLESLTIFNSNKPKQKSSINNSLTVIEIDTTLRSQIKQISFDYWKNPEKQFLQYKEYLLSIPLNSEVKINTVEVIKDSKNTPVGYLINWNYKDKTYETKEKIASRTYSE